MLLSVLSQILHSQRIICRAMDAPDEKAAQKAIEYGITIFHALRIQTNNVTEAMISASALLRAVAEKFPDVAHNYERYRAEASKDSPLAEKNRAICAEFERIEKQLQKLKG